jgi:long-subunit fatty acid transport protein
MRTTISRTLLAALALVAAAAAARAQTTGYLLSCSPASQLGRGCTLLGGGADPVTMLSNPAGLASMASRSLTVSGAAFLPSLEYSNAVNSAVAGAKKVYPLPAVVFAAPSGGALSWGVGAQTLGGMGADYTLTHALLGADQTYHSKFGLMEGGLSVAYRLTPALALGATVGALYGQLEFTTPYSVSPASFQGLAGLAADPSYATLMANFHEATAAAALTGLSGFAFAAGASVEFRPSPTVALALAYTAPATITLGGGSAAMDMTAQFNQLYAGMVAAKGGDATAVNTQLAGFGLDMAAGMAGTFDTKVDFGVPQTLTASFGVAPRPGLHLGLDVSWIGYTSAFADMPLTMTGGSNANINILMNASPTVGTFAASWPLDWKDAWVVRAGGELAATPTLTLRAGAIVGTNPVPENTLFTIFPAIVQNAVTGGVAYDLGRMALSLSYAHTFRASQTGAATNLVATEYQNAVSKLAEDTFAAGLTWRF